MRRLVILALLFGLMLALPVLQVGGPGEAFSPLSLATFGFILLAAYTLGDIAGRVGLPRITGYIATGIVFGPSVVNLFSVQVVQDLRVINGLAIGLIALSAGGEMKLASLRSVAKSLTLIVVVKGALILAAVTGAVVLARPLLPFLADAPLPLAASVGLVFGVLAMGTSPAATIAVIGETGAKGRLADTTLGVAVMKDIVMVIGLAVAIALVQVFSTPDAHFEAAVLLHVGQELGLSILAGAILGVVIIAYLRYIGAELWLFVIAVVFAMTAIAEALHLEALLTFIVAGFVVQNVSKHGDDFIHRIESVALPVYVVFFSVAGAGLDLGALSQIGVVALILVVVRLGAIWSGTALATWLAGEPAPIRRYGWMAFVSQAGVVIGLTILVEANLPALGPDIRTVVIGTVAINLLLGPVLFKTALARVGETASAASRPEAVTEQPDEPVPAGSGDPALPEPAFRSPRLQEPAQRLRAGLTELLTDFDREVLAPTAAAHRAFLGALREETLGAMRQAARDVPRAMRALPDPDARHEAAVRVLRRHRETLANWLQPASARVPDGPGSTPFLDLAHAAHNEAKGLPDKVFVRIETDRLVPLASDPVAVRVRKALRRTSLYLRRVFSGGAVLSQRVPIRRIGRYHVGGRLPEAVRPAANQAAALPVFTLEKTRVLFAALETGLQALVQRDAETALAPDAWHDALGAFEDSLAAEFDQADADLDRFRAETSRRLALAIGRIYGAVLDDLTAAAEGDLSPRTRRFSRVHESAQAALRTLPEDVAAWTEAARGTRGWLLQVLELLALFDRVRQIVDETALQVGNRLREEVAARLNDAVDAVAHENEALAQPVSEEALVAVRETLDARLGDVLAPLQALRANQALSVHMDRLMQRFGDVAAEVPETFDVVDPATLPTPEAARSPDDLRLREVPVRLAARTFLETRLARVLTESNQALLREVNAAAAAVAEVLQQIRFNLDAALDSLEAAPDASPGDAEPDDAPATRPDTEPATGPEHAARVVADGLRRAETRLTDARDRTTAFATETRTQLTERTENLLEELKTAVNTHSEIEARFQRGRLEALDRGTRALAGARAAIGSRLRTLRTLLRRRLFPLAQDFRRDLRAGLPLDELSPEEHLDRADQAILDGMLDRFPFIYRKLFELEPLREGGEFLFGRDEEMKTALQAVRRWTEGRPTPLAVVGAPGAGVSSFLYALKRTAAQHHRAAVVACSPALRTEAALTHALAGALNLPQVDTLDALQPAIAAAPAPLGLVALDGVEQLTARCPDGFDLVRRLIALSASTSRHIAWAFGTNAYAWTWLDGAVGIDEAVTVTIRLAPLSRGVLEEALLARHRISGLALEVRPSASLLTRFRYRRADQETRHALARRDALDRLHRLSRGNPLTALFLWLHAAAPDSDHIVLRPPEPLRLGYIAHLDESMLRTLRVVLEGGPVRPGACAAQLGVTTERATALLAYLTRLHLLAATPYGYALHRPVAATVARELARLGLVRSTPAPRSR